MRDLWYVSKRLVTVLAATMLAMVPALAQDKFPSRPIEMIIPTPAGGGTDITMRKLASIAEQSLGQKVVIINKPGAVGTVGVAALVAAKSDGYTIGGLWNSPLTMTPHQIAVPYKPDDYVPITLANSAPLVFCVKPDFPARDGKEFIELLRKNPGKYTYGGDGIGGTVHLAGERIFTKLGVSGNARIIPFNSAGETLQNFLGGHVDIYGGSFPPIMPHLKDKAMRCVLVTSAERSFVAPDVTALVDLGIPGEATPVWGGLIAPKGTPADRIAVLEKAFSDAARSQEYRDYMRGLGTEAVGSSAGQFKIFLDAEYSAMAQVVKNLGLVKK